MREAIAASWSSANAGTADASTSAIPSCWRDFRADAAKRCRAHVRRRLCRPLDRPPLGPLAGSGAVELRRAFGLVDERTKGSLPPLDKVREAARREWLHARQIAAKEALRRLRDRYEIVVEKPRRPARNMPKRRHEAPRASSALLGALLAPAGARARHAPRLSRHAPDGARHLFRALEVPGHGRPAARGLPEAARERERGGAAAGAFLGDAYVERWTVRAAAGSPARPSQSTAFQRAARTCWCASRG